MSPQFSVYFFLSILFLFFRSEVVMAIEEPKYTVETQSKVYEVRKYQSTLVAETWVDAKFDDAGNKAFRILADYIFGNNTTKTEISMTAPVAQSRSEKIAMTAPVSQIKGEKGYLVQFTMPSQFPQDSLPKPNDSRVVIRELPERRVAVLKYSGSWSESRYQQKLADLKAALVADQLQAIGEPIFARFNSPFQLWFLRRNEIWIEIQE